MSKKRKSKEPQVYRAFLPFDGEGHIEIAPGMFISRDTEIMIGDTTIARMDERGIEIIATPPADSLILRKLKAGENVVMSASYEVKPVEGKSE